MGDDELISSLTPQPVTIFVDNRTIHGVEYAHGALDPASHLAMENSIKSAFQEGRVPTVERHAGHIERE